MTTITDINNNVSSNHKNKVAIIFSIGLILYGVYFFAFRPYERTDNAYINANTITISPQVPGIVSKIYLEDNQYVQAGALLFEIDAKPFIIEVQNAQAQLELMGNSVRKAFADVDEAQAIVEQRAAELQQAQLNTNRVIKLVTQKVLPPETKDNAVTHLHATQAALDASEARLQQLRIALGKLGADNEQIRIATAALDKAKLNLSYTKVHASDNGQISNFTLYPGQYVSTGANLFALISDQKFWVEANFKETQLKYIKTGQRAKINIDMYPDKDFEGIVESISGASGTEFSLLPPQNATGNWVKVTQRVPVKIEIINADPGYPLRIGTSAKITIRVE